MRSRSTENYRRPLRLQATPTAVQWYIRTYNDARMLVIWAGLWYSEIFILLCDFESNFGNGGK
jgi:hypothetical protein